MSADHCETCGAALRVGQWPWCPHEDYRGAIVPDSFGCAGMWIENLDAQSIWIESKSQLKREAAARGLRWDPDYIGKARPKADDDVRGRFNGGALPTYRELHRPG